MVKAIIMAGGEGSRLRPLTCDLPKPMARLCGRPVMEYILELLAENGFTDATATLGYLPESIMDYFEAHPPKDMTLRFVREEKPLGTAGSVKNACPTPDDHLLILSGDAMCDFDLAGALARHLEAGADATLLVKGVDDPREYGLVCTDSQGVITGFVEKPSYLQAVSELANTGIYLLSPAAAALIPTGEKFDFAKNLFPLMMERGMKLLAVEDQGYWCDIGDLASYLRCQQDMLAGKVRCRLAGRGEDGCVFAQDRPTGRWQAKGPVYIGPGVKIATGAVLEGGCILDSRCQVGQGAHLTGSLLLEGASVGREAACTDAILCAGAWAGDHAMIFEGAVVGAGSRVGAGAVISPGVKIWPHRDIAPAARITEHVKRAVPARCWFDDDGINDHGCAQLTPALCARVGAALGSVVLTRPVAIACAGEELPRLYKEALISGILSAGASPVDLGEGLRGRYNFAMDFLHLTVGVYITGGEEISLQITGEAGLPASRGMERDLEAILSRGEVQPAGSRLGKRHQMEGVGAFYRGALRALAPAGLEGVHCTVRCSHKETESLLQELLASLGCGISGSTVVWLDPGGQQLTLYDGREVVGHQRLLALGCQGFFERGCDVALPWDAPQLIDRLAQESRRRVLRYFACPADESDTRARHLAAAQLWSRDGLMLLLRLLAACKDRGESLPQLVRQVPALGVVQRVAAVGVSPSAIISRLGVQQQVGEGIVIPFDKGSVLVRPAKNGAALRVLAEAASVEIADSLCENILAQLQVTAQALDRRKS